MENIGGNNKPILDSNGTLFLMVPTIINFACLMDVTYFPYDRQACDIKVRVGLVLCLWFFCRRFLGFNFSNHSLSFLSKKGVIYPLS